MPKFQIPKVFCLSSDTRIKAFLAQKDLEYRKRLDKKDVPEEWLVKNPDAFLKRYMIDRLLIEGKLDKDALFRDLLTKFSVVFTSRSCYFDPVFATIWDYNTTGGLYPMQDMTYEYEFIEPHR